MKFQPRRGPLFRCLGYPIPHHHTITAPQLHWFASSTLRGDLDRLFIVLAIECEDASDVLHCVEEIETIFQSAPLPSVRRKRKLFLILETPLSHSRRRPVSLPTIDQCAPFVLRREITNLTTRPCGHASCPLIKA